MPKKDAHKYFVALTPFAAALTATYALIGVLYPVNSPAWAILILPPLLIAEKTLALEAARGQKTLAGLADEHEVHANQITQWKKQLLESLPEVFGRRRERDAAQQEKLSCRLYRQIGQLKVELDWLKKSGLGG